MNEWTKDFCLTCDREMRKWITHEESILDENILTHNFYIPVPESAICQSMCINPDCPECGNVYRTIQNQDSFKIETSIEL